MDTNTRIVDMTLDDLLKAINQREQSEQPRINYVYGISGIAALLGCSVATAQRLKSSGRIDAAIVQIGRKIMCNADVALKLLSNPK